MLLTEFMFFLKLSNILLKSVNLFPFITGDGLRLDELLGNSTWLEGRLNEALDISPDLAESLSTAVLKPEQVGTGDCEHWNRYTLVTMKT